MLLRNSLKVNSWNWFGEGLKLSHAQNLTVENLP